MTHRSDEPDPPEKTDIAVADADAEARRRRERLTELRNEAVKARAEAGPGEQEGDEDPELQTFLDDLVEKKNRRKTQLALVKAFFTDPLRFSTGLNDEPEIESADDLVQRRSLLEDQIDLLSTILEAAKTELEQLDKALVDSDSERPDTA